MAVNPCTGRLWYAFSAPRHFGCCPSPDPGKNHQWYNAGSNWLAHLGQFVTMGPDDVSPTNVVEGPGAIDGTEIVGVHFSSLNNKVYALSYDLAAGTYTLSSADNPEADQCCPVPSTDSDEDGDVDMIDFAKLQTCFTLTAGQFDPVNCGCFDRNFDQIINGPDLASFLDCVRGPGISVQPGCGN